MDDKIVKDYKKRGEDIVYEMTKVLMKAQKKADDKKYREALEKLNKI